MSQEIKLPEHVYFTIFFWYFHKLLKMDDVTVLENFADNWTEQSLMLDYN